MLDVALEVPLGALALGRGGERHHLAAARIEPLGHPLDGAALAGGIAALEQHDHLELLVDHPVLQLDELLLEPQQLLEIFPAVHPVRGFAAVLEQRVEPVVVDFELELFIDAVDELVMDAVAKLGLPGVDAHFVPIGERPGTRPEACDFADFGEHP